MPRGLGWTWWALRRVGLNTVELTEVGTIIEWRGPSPHHFVELSAAQSDAVSAVARVLTYGWGAIPAQVRLGSTTWTTSLFPRNGRYLVPIKAAVRAAEQVGLGDAVELSVYLDA